MNKLIQQLKDLAAKLNRIEENSIQTDVLSISKLINDLETNNEKLNPNEFSQIVHEAFEGVVVTDEEGRVIFWSKKMNEISGLAEQDAIGKYIWDIQLLVADEEHKNDINYNQLKSTVKSLLSTGNSELIGKKNDRQFTRKDKSVKWIESVVFAIKTTDGFKLYVLFNDVTQIYEQKINLAQSKYFSDLLYKVSPNAMFSVDNNKIVTTWNDKAAQITGYTAEEIVGKECLMFSELPCKLNCGLLNKDIPKPISNKECVIKTKEGKTLIIRKNVDVIIDFQGNPIGGIETFDDITELTNTEHRFKTESKINKIIGEISTEALRHDLTIEKIAYLVHQHCLEITSSPHGYVGSIDASTGNLISHTLTAMMNNGCKMRDANIVFPKVNGVYPKLWGHSLNEKKSFYTNNPDKHEHSTGIPEGHVKFTSFLSVPAIVNDNLVGQIALANKQGGYNDQDLENVQRIANVYAIAVYRKMTETELIKAKNKAEESDKLKSAFLANMSHEVRTPMNSIVGFSELLKNPELSAEKKHKYISLLKNSCNSLNQLINDIIDISRIETKSVSLFKENVNIDKLLIEIEAEANILINTNNKKIKVSLNLHKSNNVEFLYCDKLRTKQVLLNFISNAIKFTQEGSIELGYSVHENRVRFYVKDTGIGISKDALEIIFERFRQADSSTTRKYGGSGLGLSISKALVELMNGEIGVISEQGAGSEFFFFLPLANASNIIDYRNTFEEIEFNEIKTTEWSGKSVLFVDDDDDTFELFKEIVDGSDIKVFRAKNGDEAIQICDSRKINLVFMDIHLPGKTGIETTKILLEKYPKLPVIAQTADVISYKKADFTSVGFIDYMSKPFNIVKTLNLIDAYLK
jgi:PAS domain S-box-containing protein